MSDRAAPSHHPLGPILMVVVAIGLFATMDALMKRASLGAGVYAALLARSLMATAVLAPAWRWRGGRAVAQLWPTGPVLRLHLVRGVIVAGMAASYFWGLIRTPLAEAIAISFIAPLIALFLAAAALGERLRARAVVGSLVALGGVGAIAAGRLRDAATSPQAGWGIAAILGSAVLYACNLVLQRRQAQVAGPLEIAAFQNAFVALTLLAVLPLGVALGAGAQDLLPPVAALPDIAAAALLASASLMMLAWAYARAEAQVLVPIEYTAFPWSALMGWLWFDEVVTGATFAGLALILAGVWIGARGAPQPQAPPA